MIRSEIIITMNETTGKMRGMIHGSRFSPPNIDGLKSIISDLHWTKSILLSLLFLTDVQHRFGLFVKKTEYDNFVSLLANIGKMTLVRSSYDRDHYYVKGFMSPKIATAIRLAT